MADSAGEKTEAPTGKRLGEARKKGQVARSGELTSAVGLAAMLLVLKLTGPAMFEGCMKIMHDGLGQIARKDPSTPGAATDIVTALTLQAIVICAPMIAIMTLSGILVGVAQTKFNFTLGALKPSFSKLNPMSGLKNLVGTNGIVEVIKNTAKLAVIGLVAWLVLDPRIDELASQTGMPAQLILPAVADMSWALCWWVTITYIVIGCFDFVYQKWNTTKQLKMTKEEVKQEAKQADVNPEVKGYIKRRQHEVAKRRMIEEVPGADVVITNPTHYSVALKFSEGDPAPRVLAKGMDLVALEIRAAAREAGVPIKEDPPTARALHASCEVGDYVPEELFLAVAHILAAIFAANDTLN